MLKSFLFVSLGGGVGSILRYLISISIGKWANNSTYATFIVNILGCLIIGTLIGIMEKHQTISNNFYNLKLLLITGFCGGFTTFSTFALENINMIESGKIFPAILYTSLSIILGLMSVFLGMYIFSNK